MRKSLLCSIALLVVLSCGSGPAVEKYDINDTFDTPIDSLYQRCQELDGVGMFKIGMSWKDVIKSKELNVGPYDRKANWFAGRWGLDKIDESSEYGDWMIKHHPELKQYRLGSPWPKYSLGSNIEFGQLDLAFFNDKLVAVYYEFDYRTNKDAIQQHYVAKYGPGIGSHTKSGWRKGLGTDQVSFDIKEFESRKWMNETIALDYLNDYSIRHNCVNYPDSYNSKQYYIVYDKARYQEFTEALTEANAEYRRSKEKSRSDALNSL